jgi:hypothetical protein
LFGNILTPAYPALYLVESAIFEEAQGTQGTVLSGQVGKLVPRGENQNDILYLPKTDEETTTSETRPTWVKKGERLGAGARIHQQPMNGA